MDKIILYSTGCPMCRALKEMLDKHNISYETCSDVDEITKSGITHVPVLEINGEKHSYPDAIKWIISNGDGNNI